MSFFHLSTHVYIVWLHSPNLGLTHGCGGSGTERRGEGVQTELGTGGVALRQRERVQTELGMGEVGQTERRGCADRTGYG